MNCVFCGPVKNCAPFLDTVFSNIEKMGTLFENYVIILYYDHSTDNTLDVINNYISLDKRIISISLDEKGKCKAYNKAFEFFK